MTDVLESADLTSGRTLGPSVTKAVIPAAGLGTRFLPATKATPKEMLPVVDKPAIQYVVEEAVSAGLSDVLVITGRNKRSLEDHFDRAWELEEALQAKGDTYRLARVQKSNVLADMHYTRQGDPRDPLLQKMIDVRDSLGGSVVALLEVPREQIHLYGCAAVEAIEGGADADTVRITDLVEKPSVDEAPSSYAVIGRYVLDPAVFRVLESTPPGRGGEIQLTDALRTLACDVAVADGGGVTGVVFRGRRYDTGDRLSYLQAVVRLACERADLGPELVPWLKEFVATL